ncbi:myo-inositol-1(or 4)-monophosphatase [Methylomarinovum caldicuralii]|uniref:Inositol-1-monophosphatase n=1 Tax=Methylomarinovum caldicuralii TaxID=438856 RepID=A0AAU9CPF0_9GAMM|nr:inositol monophosphatase family protein [Methylomarinovum caldicuralii]BCX81848.1 myo-inositol-1(or 4)-monophosphatase [Methylomarinovum caldicuralii]
MHPMLNIATRAARRAGALIVRALDDIDRLDVDVKGRNDFVSEVDRSAEREIIRILKKAYPHHQFLGEEGGRQGKRTAREDEYLWIIDPLDGTTNFLHGFPQFAVSIALQHAGCIEQAVVYDPLRQEMFTASRGRGAALNNRRIRVSRQTSLLGSLLGTGFPFKQQQHLDAYLQMFRALFKDSAGIRRAGAASLDLAYVASGRLDGFWEIGLQPWDMAAGVLLIQEAGGIVSDFSGGDRYMETGNIVAGTPKLQQIICQTIAPYVTDDLL